MYGWQAETSLEGVVLYRGSHRVLENLDHDVVQRYLDVGKLGRRVARHLDGGRVAVLKNKCLLF